MKRDMNLIRLLLLDLEGAEEVDLSTYSDEAMQYHKRLVIEAGLAKGSIASSHRKAEPNAFLAYLTSNGHDFLDAARDDTIWKQATEAIGKSVGSTTLDVLKSVLTMLATRAIKQLFI